MIREFTDMKQKSIFLAAGGTGGHVYPAYALAAHLIQEGYDVTLLTDRRGASYPKCSLSLKVVQLPLGRKGGGIFSLGRWLFSMVFSVGISFYHLIKESPSMVLGFGGFPSAPTLVAAILLKPILHHKIILHEQNAVVGKVNRWLIRFVDKVAVSFPKTWGIKKCWEGKVVVTGNFVRPEFREGFFYEPFQEKGPIHILVIGGSQGARSFSTLVPHALKALPAALKNRLCIHQQCRSETLEATRAFYKDLHIKTIVESFFSNIPALMREAHLVICRAGSSTVFEVATTKRPAIYIPFPYAMDNHQYFNALVIQNMGGGWIFDEAQEDKESLNKLVYDLLTTPKKLATASQNVHDLVKEDAAMCFSKLIQSL